MKFLVDNNIANRISRALSSAGHEIVRAALDYPDWADDDLLALAAGEGWIIVTQDSDFSDLIYAFGMAPPPAIIYIRSQPEDQLIMADRVLETIASGRLAGSLAVVRPDGTRYRPLPGKEIEE